MSNFQISYLLSLKDRIHHTPWYSWNTAKVEVLNTNPQPINQTNPLLPSETTNTCLLSIYSLLIVGGFKYFSTCQFNVHVLFLFLLFVCLFVCWFCFADCFLTTGQRNFSYHIKKKLTNKNHVAFVFFSSNIHVISKYIHVFV